MERKIALLFVFSALGLLYCAPCSAQTVSEKSAAVRTGQSFQVAVDGMDTRLLVISSGSDGKSFEIEYPDTLSAGSPSDQGPCRPVEGKHYRVKVTEGFCFMTNTCDGGTNVCFKKIKTDGDGVHFDYSVGFDNRGILGFQKASGCERIS